jgi:hypothetical protein
MIRPRVVHLIATIRIRHIPSAIDMCSSLRESFSEAGKYAEEKKQPQSHGGIAVAIEESYYASDTDEASASLG